MRIKNIILATALLVVAGTSCKKSSRPDFSDEPTRYLTEGLTVVAEYCADYYSCGFQDYLLYFQIGERNSEGAFVKNGVELCLDILTPTGGASFFPEGKYMITNNDHNAAGIIPSIPITLEDVLLEQGISPEGYSKEALESVQSVQGSYYYTQNNAEEYWLMCVDDVTLDIESKGALYKISVDFVVDGRQYSYYYEGSLAIVDSSTDTSTAPSEGPEGDYCYRTSEVSALNMGHIWNDETDDWEIWMLNENDYEAVVLEIVAPTGIDHSLLPEGTFSIPADFFEISEMSPWTLCPIYQYDETYYGTYYIFDDQIWYQADSGRLKISRSGDKYTLDLQFKDTEYDSTVSSTFTGTVTVDISNYYAGELLSKKSVKNPATKGGMRMTARKVYDKNISERGHCSAARKALQ